MPNGTNSEDHLSNGWKGDETDVQITASRYKHNGGWSRWRNIIFNTEYTTKPKGGMELAMKLDFKTEQE